MAYLTNESMRAGCPPSKCPGCFGWGFPIMAFKGKETYNVHVRCDECGGDGTRASYDARVRTRQR